MLRIIKKNKFYFFNIYVLTVLVTVLTVSELLSSTNKLNFNVIRIFSFLIIMISTIIITLNLKIIKIFMIQNLYFALTSLLVMSLTAIAGIFISPNLWDSMTYHLPRFLHWDQNQNLKYFTTSIYRQNESPVLPDLIYMWIFSIFKSDHFIFLLPWLGIFLSAILIYKISFHISRNKIVAQLSGILSLLLPNQIGFMSSSQTDPLTTYLVLLVLYVIITRDTRSQKLNYLVYVGILPILLTAKTTALIFSLPLYLFIFYKDRSFIKKHFLILFPLTLLIATLAVPSYFRLLSYFLISDASKSENSVNAVFIAEYSLGKNLLNFLYITVSLFQTPIKYINDRLERVVSEIQFEKMDFSREFYLSENLHADFAAPFLIVAIVVLSLIARNQIKLYKNIYLLMLFQLILLSAIVEWQPWINRFTTTVIMIGAIPLGFYIYNLRKLNAFFAVSLIVGYSSFWLFFNPTRTLLDPIILEPVAIRMGIDSNDLLMMKHDLIFTRDEQYFSARAELANSYLNAVKIIEQEQPTVLSLYVGDDDFEYPLWALTKYKFNLLHTDVIQLNSPREIILCTKKCDNTTYPTLYVDDNLVLYSGNEN